MKEGNWNDVMWKRSQSGTTETEETCCDSAGDVLRVTCLQTWARSHVHSHTLKEHIFQNRLSDSTPCCHSLCFVPLEDAALIFVYRTQAHGLLSPAHMLKCAQTHIDTSRLRHRPSRQSKSNF